MNQILATIFSLQTAFAQTSEKSSGVASATGEKIQNLTDTFLSAIPLWITGAFVIVISFIIAKIVKSGVENKMAEQGFEEEHHEMQIVASRTSSAAVLIIGVTVGLKIAGIDLTGIIAAGAFGVGFAMKDIIMNFLAGIIVLLQKQYTIGDWIKIGGTTGVIESIQSRSTVIRNFDGTKVIIPNGDLFRKQVTTYTTNPLRRFQFDLGIDLYSDLKEVIDVIYKSTTKVKKILQTPKPNVIVLPPGPFANTLRIRCWVESKKGILGPQSALIKQIHRDFYKRGWSWPYPTQTLIFDKDAMPDVNERAKTYIKKHKKTKTAVPTIASMPVSNLPSAQALQQEAGFIQQQQEILGPALASPSLVLPPQTPPAAESALPAQISGESSKVQVPPVTVPPVIVPPIVTPQTEAPSVLLPLPDVSGNQPTA